MTSVDTHHLSRLEQASLAYRLLCECGDDGGSAMGAVVEVYAEEELGMVTAPKGTRGYDGILNGRRPSG